MFYSGLLFNYIERFNNAEYIIRNKLLGIPVLKNVVFLVLRMLIRNIYLIMDKGKLKANKSIL